MIVVAVGVFSYFRFSNTADQTLLVVTPAPIATTTGVRTSPVSTTNPNTHAAPTPQTQQTTVAAPAPAPNTTFLVSGASYRLYLPQGTTVLDAMHTLASTTSFSFTGHSYLGLGFFIDSIGGKENADGFYWFLYVNGKSSDTGASQTTLHAGDTVEWRYEKNY